MNAVLTKASAGEKLEIGYKVLIIHSAVVRVDYMVYGYNVSASSGISDMAKNGLVCVATVGVVDFKSIGLETLVYLVGTQCAQVSMLFRTVTLSGVALSCRNSYQVVREHSPVSALCY